MIQSKLDALVAQFFFHKMGFDLDSKFHVAKADQLATRSYCEAYLQFH